MAKFVVDKIVGMTNKRFEPDTQNWFSFIILDGDKKA